MPITECDTIKLLVLIDQQAKDINFIKDKKQQVIAIHKTEFGNVWIFGITSDCIIVPL